MLLKDLYTINHLIQQADNGQSKITAELVINKSHHIFQGHFPGLPVVPGVCMVQIIKELVEQNVGKSLMLREAGNIKFLSMINPEVNSKVIIRCKSKIKKFYSRFVGEDYPHGTVGHGFK